MTDIFIHSAHKADCLLKECPREAASLLARLYRDDSGVRSEIDSILHLQRTAPQNASPFSRITSTAVDRAPGHEHSSSSQRSTSPVRRRTSTLSDYRSTPLSPRSTGSRSTRGSSTSGEYILILDVTEDSEEQPVRMRTAPIEHSLIRKDLALRRIKSTEPIEGNEFQTLAPTRVDPDTLGEVSVSDYIELTWRRRKSDMTHRTTFFLVAEDLLDTDVILGFNDTGEGYPGFPITFTSRPQQPQSFMHERRHQEIRPPAPTPQPAVDDHSFHRSQNPTHYPSQPSFPQRTETYAAEQMSQRLQAEQRQLVPSLAATTVRDIHLSHFQHSQSDRTPTSDRDFGASDRRLRLKLKWDATTINVWLNLDGPAEAFFLALQQQLSKRRPVLDRTLMTIYLKPQEQSRDEEAQPLSLGPDELDADWIETVKWLEVNKQDRPPHIFGRVEVTEG